MKPTSPLSLLSFLSLTTALPIPSMLLKLELQKDCLHYTTCQPWLREIQDSYPPRKTDRTPVTRLPNPHFPSHQLNPPLSSPEAHREAEAAFNNAPLIPPEDQSPTIALSAARPLHSSYLLSLSYSTAKDLPEVEPQSTHSTVADAPPSKPTSALPELRLKDALRYWATAPTVSVKKVEEDIARPCSGNPRLARPIVLARDYSDVLVVGIVLLFLAAVFVMEAVEYCADLRLERGMARRGEIFLDEKVQFGKYLQDESPVYGKDQRRS